MNTQNQTVITNGCQVMTNWETGTEPFLWFLSRKKGDTVRRIKYWGRMLAVKVGAAEAEPPRQALPLADASAFSPGKRVRVKNLEDILPMLDKLGRLSGCKFLEPMARHCGQETYVVKRVDRFFDEARRRMLKCKNVVLLDNTICDGSGHPDTMGCDRMCLYFWRTEWLEPID